MSAVYCLKDNSGAHGACVLPKGHEQKLCKDATGFEFEPRPVASMDDYLAGNYTSYADEIMSDPAEGVTMEITIDELITRLENVRTAYGNISMNVDRDSFRPICWDEFNTSYIMGLITMAQIDGYHIN